jgi:alkylhydroperoxidase/carboxymuconolactone decarboxylase family protein YurZ
MKAFVALAVAAALGAGIFIGASIRPALAGGNDDEHRIAVATEQIARQLENVSRHVEGLQRCSCK